MLRINPFRKQRPVITLRLDIAILIVTVPSLLLISSLLSLTSHVKKLDPTVTGQALYPSSINSSATLQQYHLVRSRLLSDLPNCSHHGRAQSFLLVFQGHSGSTALMTSLRQHSQTLIDGFEPVDHGIFAEKTENASLHALQYTKTFFTNATNMNLTAGFKIRPTHLLRRPLSFFHIVQHFHTRIVWSYRSNILKQAIGDYRIHYYNDTVSYEGIKLQQSSNHSSTHQRPTSIQIGNMTKLFKLMVGRVRADRNLALALHAVRPDSCLLPVSYESYLRSPTLTLERVQRFLGLSLDEIHPPERAKANQDSLCDLVSNWHDVCRAFFPCVEWRWMLDDYENGCSCSNLPASSFKTSISFCDFNAKP